MVGAAELEEEELEVGAEVVGVEVVEEVEAVEELEAAEELDVVEVVGLEERAGEEPRLAGVVQPTSEKAKSAETRRTFFLIMC